jgi:ubiquinone/menaquinone biosynthesis C-methylase UbiE
MAEDFYFICPVTHQRLKQIKNQDGNDILVAEGVKYQFIKGIPDLIYPSLADSKEKSTFEFYENRADVYDKFLYQTFKTHNEDENATRNGFIDKLNLKPDSKILEVACGTGRDSELIARRLSRQGMLVLQDISPSMLNICKEKLSSIDVEKIFCISNAAYLPFPDSYFDATYSFGGLGEFPEIKRSLAEMVRVTKVGGKIVVGDESMPPWLRNTYFSKVLSKTNPQFLAEVPLKDIPVEARKFKLQYVIGGVFYLIDFEVGKGEPTGDFDYLIEGIRGGSLRTRLEGELEGVTNETKELAYRAAKAKGLSMHAWLDLLVKKEAKKDLNIRE